MSFNISTLRSKMESVGGFTKGERFHVILTPPSGLGLPTGQGSTTDLLQFITETTELPTRSVATQPQDIYGPPREFAYRTTFTEIAMNFYLDDDMSVKNYFDTWQESIVDQFTGNTNYWDNYTCQIKIQKLSNLAEDLNDKIKYEINLIEAYPSIVGNVGLGHAQGGEIKMLPITFKFRKWERVGASVIAFGN